MVYFPLGIGMAIDGPSLLYNNHSHVCQLLGAVIGHMYTCK